MNNAELLRKAKLVAKHWLEDGEAANREIYPVEEYPTGCPCEACEAAREIMKIKP